MILTRKTAEQQQNNRRVLGGVPVAERSSRG